MNLAMGSGSSKAKSLTARETSDLSPRKPVANVNKLESPVPTTTETARIHPTNNNNVVADKQDRDADSASQFSDYGNKQSRVDKDKKISGYNNDSPSALQFEDDSDYSDDIDTILEIPVALDKSKQGGNKQKKIQEHGGQQNSADRVHNVSATKVSEYTEAPLPETYAQRMQRQQYTLQQHLLVHDKDVVKSPPEWQQDSDEDDVNKGSSQIRFDASKFRAVNKGRGFKNDVFASGSEGFKTQHRFDSPTEHNLDDLEVNPREDIFMVKQLPQYNQSELDLMRQLEDGIL